MVMDEDGAIGITVLLFVIACGLFNAASMYHRTRHAGNTDYFSVEDVV